VTREGTRYDDAVTVVNEHNIYTSVLNLMELRSVLSKKKRFERDRIQSIEQTIVDKATITFPDASDIMNANRYQQETLLYPMDALILAAATAIDAPLVTFDKELLDNGGTLPEDL